MLEISEAGDDLLVLVIDDEDDARIILRRYSRISAVPW
jgi:hypothetical protein